MHKYTHAETAGLMLCNTNELRLIEKDYSRNFKDDALRKSEREEGKEMRRKRTRKRSSVSDVREKN